MKPIKTLNTGVALAALGLTLVAAPAMAQSAPAQPAQTTPDISNTDHGAPAQAEEIVVTGSSIKRINTETASPLTVLSAKDLANTGYDSVANILSNLTSNGAGTLSSNNSEAFAGGASGIALRGLSVGATLVLVDGHRLAPYPLSDDGERQFTDVQSIPLFAVEGVEVLKDGASAVYGSDAIAGVVNIKLKKQITGAEAQFDFGDSQHGGGQEKHVALALGKGDLARDGYNFFVTAEFRDQQSISLSQRADYADWGNMNFSRFGGNNLLPGAPNALNSGVPFTQTPYLVNPNGSYSFLNSSCNTAKLNAGQCTYNSPQLLMSPTRNVNLLLGFTKDFGNGWEVKVRASMFDSEGQQTGAPYTGGNGYNVYPGASYAGNVSNPYSGTPVPSVGAIAAYTLPANYMGSGNAAGAFLEGVVAGVGMPTIDIDSKTWRGAIDVTGDIAGWDFAGALGGSYVVTTEKFYNYVNYDNLYTALTNGTYNPLGGNSQSTIDTIAPAFRNLATDKLLYAEAHASRKVAALPGGDVSVALGASVVHTSLNNPGPESVLSGDIGGTFSTYAFGQETDIAEYLEVDGTMFHTLEFNGALRDDYYTTYGNSLTPKAGLTWRAQPWLMLRGTFSKGFRAPAPAEFGHAQTLFGLGGFADPVLCPNGSGGPFPAGTIKADCSEQIGFAQTTTSNLKPERSTSFTAGSVIQPIKNWSTTFDYYHITIKDQIISESELPSYSFSGSNCVRGADLATTGVSDGAGGTGTAVPLAGPLAACFAGYVNAQSTTTSGLDINSEYKFHLGGGMIHAKVDWTHMFNYNLTAPDGTIYHLAGTHGPSGVSGDTGNPRDRINASIGYDQGPFSMVVSGYWIASYSVTDPSASGGAQATCAGAWNAAYAFAQVTPSSANSQFCRVASFTSINLMTSYQFTPKVKMSFTVNNLFDARAPLDAETYGGSFIPVNPSMDMDGIIGRFFRVTLNVKY
jgi:iron complex outermembrane recepter protein